MSRQGKALRKTRSASAEKTLRLVEKVVKCARIASYVLSAALAAYGAWWFTIPRGWVIGVVLLIVAMILSLLASRELRSRRYE